MIGKRIDCYLDTATGDKTPFIADVKPGRHEGEVYLAPIEPADKPEGYVPPPRGYTARGIIYVRKIVGEGDATPPSNLTVMADLGLVAAPEPEPAAATAEAAPAQPELSVAETTESRRLSESPISKDTRSRRGRGGPADHGAAAAQADEFAEKP